MTAHETKARLATRLQAAREAAGYSKTDVAKLLGTDRQRVHGMETGDRPVDVTTLLQLARLYGRDASSFLTDEEPDITAVPVELRSASQPLSAESRAAIQLWGHLCGMYAQLQTHYGESTGPGRLERWLRDGGSSRLRDFAIEGHAQAVRQEMGLDEDSIGARIFNLISSHGIPVFRIALGQTEVEGAFVNYPGLGPVILVNRDKLLTRQIFTAAHELGHVIYEARKQGEAAVTFLGQKNPSEPQIDRFASSFLMPRTAIDLFLAQYLQQGEEGLGADDVVHLQRHFGVSYSAMLVRLRRLGHLSAARFDELKRVSPLSRATRLGYVLEAWEYGTPPPSTPEAIVSGLPKAYVTLVLRGLEDGVLSQAAAAEAMMLNLEELERYLYTIGQHEPDLDSELAFYDEHVA